MNIWTGVIITGFSLIALVITFYVASLHYSMTETQAYIYILLGLLELLVMAIGLFGIASRLTGNLFEEPSLQKEDI